MIKLEREISGSNTLLTSSGLAFSRVMIWVISLSSASRSLVIHLGFQLFFTCSNGRHDLDDIAGRYCGKPINLQDRFKYLINLVKRNLAGRNNGNLSLYLVVNDKILARQFTDKLDKNLDIHIIKIYRHISGVLSLFLRLGNGWGRTFTRVFSRHCHSRQAARLCPAADGAGYAAPGRQTGQIPLLPVRPFSPESLPALRVALGREGAFGAGTGTSSPATRAARERTG